MSFEYYTNWWIVTRKHLENAYLRDQLFRDKKRKTNKRNVANNLIGGMYVRYCLLVKEMAECYDQMVQPQKRLTVRKLMDAAVIRLNEFNNEMRKISLSEVHYVDDTLMELKIVPYDIEILHPMLFYPRPFDVEDMWQKLKKGERIFDPATLITNESAAEDVDVKQSQEVKLDSSVPTRKSTASADNATEKKRLPVQKEESLTPEEMKEKKRKDYITRCINMVQKAERFRQGRGYFFIKKLLLERKKDIQKFPEKQPKAVDKSVLERAAVKIQRAWRQHDARSKEKLRQTKERFLIGMYEPSYRSTEAIERYKENLERRRVYRDLRMREYLEDIEKEKIRILKVVAPGLLEDIGDEIREWFRVWYKEAKTFPKYPSEEKGGTILVMRCETVTPKEYLDEYERKRRAKVKGKGKDPEKERAKKEKLKKKQEEKKRKADEKKKKAAEMKKRKLRAKRGEYELEYEDTAMVAPYQSGLEEYKEVWDPRDDFENPLEKHFMEFITEEECYEVQLETRKIADEMMRVELEILEEALEADKIRMKGKKGKRKKKKKNKKKKKKKGKKGKKDITGNRKVEDLFQELFDNGIIRTYPEVYLEEYKGDFNYIGYELRKDDCDPQPGLMDIRQVVTMNCIIPLGVTEMKKPKSVLIGGPAGSGKHLLANAIFNETRCVVFDISPEVTAGKYEGKAGMKMLFHLITKMSKMLSPSIIFIDGAEKLFYKKVPKDEKEFDPKRLGKKLIKKIIKPITPQDRVLVLGITAKPWAGKAGKMKKAFERNILIPRPNYASVYMFWRQILMSYHNIDRNFNVSALTTMTVNYPLPVLREVLEKILTPRRIIRLYLKPLTPSEVFEYFVSNNIEPISDKEYKKFMKWYLKSPFGRERAQFNKVVQQRKENEKRAQERKK